MNPLMNALPGMKMPVDEVTHALAHMWDSLNEANSFDGDTRASQLNLVLHFGLTTTPDEAVRLFDDCITFAQQYPCRIIVLCPSEEPVSGFEGKLFSQCYVGENLRYACCCEGLILGYSLQQSDFLEHQVSLWTEADLPIYHWFHRVPADRISSYYLEYLQRCRRILFDGEIEGDGMDYIDWPDKNRVRDLAYARTLPLRQHIGQFLSGFDKHVLVDGLECLRIQYHKGLWRTARQLMNWHRKAVTNCYDDPADADSVIFTVEQLVEERSRNCLFVDWEYSARDKYIKWSYEQSLKVGNIQLKINGQEANHPLHIEPMSTGKVLAEAMFFG